MVLVEVHALHNHHRQVQDLKPRLQSQKCQEESYLQDVERDDEEADWSYSDVTKDDKSRFDWRLNNTKLLLEALLQEKTKTNNFCVTKQLWR